MATITLTLEQIQAMIDATVERKFQEILHEIVPQLENDQLRVLYDLDDDPRTQEEVLKSIDENMWMPPPGSKSTLELLREDRDS